MAFGSWILEHWSTRKLNRSMAPAIRQLADDSRIEAMRYGVRKYLQPDGTLDIVL